MPKNAIESLLSDHKMARKLLDGWTPENPRHAEIFKTLTRVLKAHAWYEDHVFLPAFRAEPLLDTRFKNIVSHEHEDIDYFLDLLAKTPDDQKKEREFFSIQLRTVLETHFAKEEDALFPLAERILDSEGLLKLGAEMEAKQAEVQKMIFQ